MTENKPRRAWDNEDGFKEEQAIIEAVDGFGSGKGKINTEALYNDRQAFYQYHQKKILVIMLSCCIYLLGVLI